jgi:TrmH family RNA methyltransferase
LKKISALAHIILFGSVLKSSEKKIRIGLIVALDPYVIQAIWGRSLRLCDWFGVMSSKETVDLYNPKVVQATMGSIARVNMSYIDLNFIVTLICRFWHIYGRRNIYKTTLPQEGIVVMGNEANGIKLEKMIKISCLFRFEKFKKLKV